MKLLWVKADNWGSRLVRWGTGGDCSHFAICFDEDDLGRGIVFHSYGNGTGLMWMREFSNRYQIIHALAPKHQLTAVEEEAVYKEILDEEAGLPYDYPALTWWAWRVVLLKVFQRPIEKSNLFQNPRMRLCTGITPAVFRALKTEFPMGVDPEITPPHELFELARESGDFIIANEWADRMNKISGWLKP